MPLYNRRFGRFLSVCLLLSAGALPAVTFNHDRVNDVDGFPSAIITAIGQYRIFFSHASVGDNIVDGLDALHAADAGRYRLAISADDATPPPATAAGTFYHFSRGNPGWSAKLTGFQTDVANGWRYPKVDIAFDKFCFIDQDAAVNQYILTISNLAAAYPATRFLYVTMPLTTDADAANVARNQYNAALRAWCATRNVYLFDVADIEAWSPGGVQQTFSYGAGTYQMLYSGYTDDGGHLNAAGAQRVAKALYSLFGQLAIDAGGGHHPARLFRDYNNDGRSDLAVFHPGTGGWFIRTLSGASLAWNVVWGFTGCIPAPGDFDHDGRDDLAVYDPASGRWFVRKLGGATLAWNRAGGATGATPVAGDYDGDGRSDLAIYSAATARWYIQRIDGAQLGWGVAWGMAGSIAVPGDYNADGRSDLAIFNPSSGRWYIETLTGVSLAWNRAWGFSGGIPVAGDFDGDDRADLAVFNPANSRWYISTLSGHVLAWNLPWGPLGCVPLAGDYDGDDISDLATYDQARGKWYIRTLDGRVLANGAAWGWNTAQTVKP